MIFNVICCQCDFLFKSLLGVCGVHYSVQQSGLCEVRKSCLDERCLRAIFAFSFFECAKAEH